MLVYECKPPKSRATPPTLSWCVNSPAKISTNPADDDQADSQVEIEDIWGWPNFNIL